MKFEEWLRSKCFQQPTPEAYDLAKSAWFYKKKDKEELHSYNRFCKYKCDKCGYVVITSNDIKGFNHACVNGVGTFRLIKKMKEE